MRSWDQTRPYRTFIMYDGEIIVFFFCLLGTFLMNKWSYLNASTSICDLKVCQHWCRLKFRLIHPFSLLCSRDAWLVPTMIWRGQWVVNHMKMMWMRILFSSSGIEPNDGEVALVCRLFFVTVNIPQSWRILHGRGLRHSKRRHMPGLPVSPLPIITPPQQATWKWNIWQNYNPLLGGHSQGHKDVSFCSVIFPVYCNTETIQN